MNKMGKQLSTVQNTYDDAIKKLSGGAGNIIKRTEDLTELGVKATKSLKKIMPTAFIEEDITEDHETSSEKEEDNE